jgi:outer membrane protein assembly factor BamB
MANEVSRMVFTGFNNRVIALDQESGKIRWDWRSPRGSGYVSLLLTDEKHLIVSVSGYTYCLDPATGSQLWFNELSGYGIGVASLASLGAQSTFTTLAGAAATDASS